MARRKKTKKIKRIGLGSLEQLSGFTGNEEDYIFMKRVSFKGARNNIIKVRGLSPGRAYRVKEGYDPKDIESFLSALEMVLENHGWYLAYCRRFASPFQYEIIDGALYSPKGIKKPQKSK